MRVVLLFGSLCLALAGCHSSATAPPTGTGIFTNGCPVAGQSTARALTSAAEKMTGTDVLATPGDYLLMNENAAFVIDAPQVGPAYPKTYYYYGGILVDGVAVSGCAQASAEHFGELAPIFGVLDTHDFGSSVLRAFRGQSISVLNDGSDGKAAIVRVHGVDDHFWLVEMTLIRNVVANGTPRALSEPMGVSLDLDYILEPGASVLQLQLHITNTSPTARSLLTGAMVLTANSETGRAWSSGHQSFGGYGVNIGAPWFSQGAGDGSYALAMDTPLLGNLNEAGMDALIDLNQAITSPLLLAAAGSAGDSVTVNYYVAVGATDANSAVQALQASAPPSLAHPMFPIHGSVIDDQTGNPAADIDVDLERKDAAGAWSALDAFRTDQSGAFSGAVTSFANASYRLATHVPGRIVARSDAFPITAMPSPVLHIAPNGLLGLTSVDGAGAAIPVRLQLRAEGSAELNLFPINGSGDISLPPGNYELSITHGYAYEVYEGTISIAASATTALHVALPKLVDTSGWLAFDSHVHAAHSIDSRLPLDTRVLSVAADGIEVFAASDHEFIGDYKPALAAAGLSGKVAVVMSEEVTATSPEHTNMYPVLPDPTHLRGAPVPWFGLDFDHIFALERARGAGITQLNHPRMGCSWMCLIKWNRLTGLPGVTDPTKVGMLPGSNLWSWDFDAFEYINGTKSVTLDPRNPDATGILDDWLNFANLGHPKTAVGVSDVHGTDEVGSARTYFQSPHGVSDFVDADLVTAIKAHRGVVSTGAFARVSISGPSGLPGGIGDTVTSLHGEFDLHVHIEAIPELAITHFVVLANCDQIAKVAATNIHGVIKYDDTLHLNVARDSTIVVLVMGGKLPMGLERGGDPTQMPRATTNPIFVDVDGNGTYDPPGGKVCHYDLSAP
jgi:hypothetical protein